jgi:hypothetical protein
MPFPPLENLRGSKLPFIGLYDQRKKRLCLLMRIEHPSHIARFNCATLIGGGIADGNRQAR